MARHPESPPRPFLKWAGGKRQLLPALTGAVAAAGPFRHYHEPFLGGGALYFALARAGRLPAGSYLSDLNQPLIETYLAVRDEVDGLIQLLHEHKRRHSEDYFYRVRSESPATPIARAARILYLNRTCYNGLYRENSKGQFNTPFGRYKDPVICDTENLRAVSEFLQDTELACVDFSSVLERAEPNDLVYFDPPYVPLSRTANFTAYSREGFGPKDQERLAQTFAALARHGVKVVLSNSMTDSTRALYEGFPITAVMATRRVNSRAERRGAIPEAIVTSFPLSETLRLL
jgi:DNA adenine methylase